MKPKHYFLDPDNPDSDVIQEAAHFIKDQGVVIYPTDTTYVFGVNALDEGMVVKLFDLKGRDYSKPFHVVVSDLQMAEEFAYISDSAIKLAKYFLPGPLTLVLSRKATISDLLVAGLPTVGIRIPNNQICLELVRKANVPLTNTTANVNGGTNPYAIDEVTISGNDMTQVDLILDQGSLPLRSPSTMIDLSVSPPKIIREGPIPTSEIFAVINT